MMDILKLFQYSGDFKEKANLAKKPTGNLQSQKIRSQS